MCILLWYFALWNVECICFSSLLILGFQHAPTSIFLTFWRSTSVLLSQRYENIAWTIKPRKYIFFLLPSHLHDIYRKHSQLFTWPLKILIKKYPYAITLSLFSMDMHLACKAITSLFPLSNSSLKWLTPKDTRMTLNAVNSFITNTPHVPVGLLFPKYVEKSTPKRDEKKKKDRKKDEKEKKDLFSTAKSPMGQCLHIFIAS